MGDVRTVTGGGALLGAIIPLVLWGIRRIPLFDSPDAQIAFDYLTLALWPSSILGMGLENANAWSTIIGGALLLALNAGLYAAIGLLFWWGLGRAHNHRVAK